MSPLAASDWLSLVPSIAGMNSLAASALLLSWVSALTGRRRQKLLARQLWHLALADVMHYVIGFPWVALRFLNDFAGVGSTRSRALDVCCQVGGAGNVFFMTSVFVEMHIALACFFGMWRLTGAQQVLSMLLPWAWLGGLTVGGAIAVLNGVSWDSTAGTCNTGSDLGLVMLATTTSIVLAICCTAYAATCAFSHRRAGSSVATRISRQTKVFLLAAIFTWCPLMLYVYFSVALRDHLVPAREDFWSMATYHLVYTFFNSNGFLNACAYAHSSRLMRQELVARDSSKPEAPAAAEREGEVTSLIVAFRSRPEVVVIEGNTTREANINALLETAELEEAAGRRRIASLSARSSRDLVPETGVEPSAVPPPKERCVELAAMSEEEEQGGAGAPDAAATQTLDLGRNLPVDFLGCFDDATPRNANGDNADLEAHGGGC